MNADFDVIVLGLGAAGSATFFHVAKNGASVLGIDQFTPPHIWGSSHGDTRITRLAIGEGEIYVPLALRTQELFAELEQTTGTKLLVQNGCLIISSAGVTRSNHVTDFFQKTLRAATSFNIEHEILVATEIRKRYPQFRVEDDEQGYLEKKAGYLIPEACIRVQLEQGVKFGGKTVCNSRVHAFSPHSQGVKVHTNQGDFGAKKLIVTAGPWITEHLPKPQSSLFTIRRQVLYWFDISAPIDRYLPDRQPVFIWELRGDKTAIYGFAAVDGPHGGLKIATAQALKATTADAVDRTVSAEETAVMYRDSVEPYIAGLSPKCVRSSVCLYTNTPDAGFVIDTHPQHENVFIVSPCSGHGFKHSAAIGEAVAELAMTGSSRYDLSYFTFAARNAELGASC